MMTDIERRGWNWLIWFKFVKHPGSEPHSSAASRADPDYEVEFLVWDLLKEIEKLKKEKAS